jgi:hypothetical protein
VGTIEWAAAREGKVHYARVQSHTLTVVREWIVKADHDLVAAGQILNLGKAAPTETVGFHAQQCIEQYLKAILVYRSIPFTYRPRRVPFPAAVGKLEPGHLVAPCS